MPPKKIKNKRQSSSQGQTQGQQNIYENLINKHNKQRKNKSKETSRQKVQQGELKTKREVQTKLPCLNYKSRKKLVNKQNQQSKQLQTSLHQYEYFDKDKKQHVNQQINRQKRLKEIKIKLIQKIMKIQAQKLKLKNEFVKIQKNFHKKLMNNNKSKLIINSENQLQAKYVIYFRDIEQLRQNKEFLHKNDEQLTDIILYKNTLHTITDFNENTNRLSQGQQIIKNQSKIMKLIQQSSDQ